MEEKLNSEGREKNGAQPLGERAGTSSEAETRRTGRREGDTAGPDGPDSDALGKGVR